MFLEMRKSTDADFEGFTISIEDGEGAGVFKRKSTSLSLGINQLFVGNLRGDNDG
jgi:hypothetical protein